MALFSKSPKDKEPTKSSTDINSNPSTISAKSLDNLEISKESSNLISEHVTSGKAVVMSGGSNNKKKKRASAKAPHARAEKQLQKSIDTLTDMTSRITSAISTLRYAPGRKDDTEDDAPLKPSEMDKLLDRFGEHYRDGREAITTLRRQEQTALTADVQQIIAYSMQKSTDAPINRDALNAARALMENGASSQEVLTALIKDAG